MSTNSNPVVVYDACVLYPALLRDLLVQLALTRTFRAKWTDLIHDEWIRNLLINRPDLKAAQFDRVRNLMNSTIQDSLVTDFEHLISSLELPDADDRHVLAAAIIAEADIVVTFNLKDFPTALLAKYGMEVKHPDNFVSELIDQNPQEVWQCLETIRARLKNPSQTFSDYMEVLLKQGLLTSVEMLRELQINSIRKV
jgi:predicted nucleic acid-binding protein